MPVTIKNVAAEAGCAVGTVSDILGGRKTERYAEATVVKVRRAADKLGYVPNSSASTLRSGRSGFIGITHSMLFTMDYGFSDPYLNTLYTGIGKAVSDHNYDYIIQNVHSVQRYGSDRMEQFLHSRQLDGFIYIYFSGSREQYRTVHEPALRKAKMPVVVIHSTAREFPFCNIGYDAVAAGRMAAGHLLGHGYPTVGFVGCEMNRGLNDDFNAGFRQALQQHGIDPVTAFYGNVDGRRVKDGAVYARSLAEGGAALPRALFVADEPLAHGMIRGFGDAGLDVPGDVAVIGFGDYYNDDMIAHSLSNVVQPGLLKGRYAGEQLFNMLEGRPGESMVLEPELKLRTSCGCSSPM